ncbi:MAG: response regulator transcription factor [Solirubrobacteraceae bacterium]|jgi:two-component system response regulator NreC
MATHLQLAQDQDASELPEAGTRTIRVVLADDHEAMRRGLRRVLDAEHDIEVVAEGEDLGATIRCVHAQRPNVLVLDLSMRSGSSIEAIRRLREGVPATEIVVLKMDESAAFAQHAIDAGAIGYVLKDTADEELPEAVRLAARRREYVSPRVAARLRARRLATGDALHVR